MTPPGDETRLGPEPKTRISPDDGRSPRVTPDPQRFLTRVPPEGEERGPGTFIVISNWFEELRAKMAVKK
jgi:hypothetical protein